MEAKSTITLTRKEAISYIQAWLYGATNERLANIVEAINEDRFENDLSGLGVSNFKVE